MNNITNAIVLLYLAREIFDEERILKTLEQEVFEIEIEILHRFYTLQKRRLEQGSNSNWHYHKS